MNRTNLTARVSHTRTVVVLEDAAANDSELTPADVDAEIRRMEADADYDRLRDSGELQRRRDERAMHEQAQQRMSEGSL